MTKVGTPHCPIPPMVNTILKICPPPPTPMPFGEVYTYPYIPPLVVPSPLVNQVEINPRIVFTQFLFVQSFDGQKGEDRKKVEFLMQSKNT